MSNEHKILSGVFSNENNCVIVLEERGSIEIGVMNGKLSENNLLDIKDIV